MEANVMTDSLTAAIKVVEKLRNGPGIYEPFGSSLIAVIAAARELQKVRAERDAPTEVDKAIDAAIASTAKGAEE
jgi:hypothetical protein